MHYAQSFQIAASIETVWAILSDIERYPEWAPTSTRVEFPGEKQLALGLRARLWVTGAPTSEFVVTRYTEGTRFAWEPTAPGVHPVADHVIEPSGGGTRLTLSVEASGFLAKLFSPMIKRVTVRNIALEGNGLKRREPRCAERLKWRCSEMWAAGETGPPPGIGGV